MLFLCFVFFTRCYSISFSSQLNSDNTQNDANAKEFWVNMPNLMTHLKKVSEQKPQATYYNVDMLKYQVRLFIWSGCLFHITNVYSFCQLKKNVQCESCESSFNWGKIRTIALEAAFQIALRNCFKEVGGKSVYM